MKTIEEAKNICRTIWHLYLEQRDYKTLATFVDQEMTLIGTGAHEICHTSAECFQKLYQEEKPHGMSSTAATSMSTGLTACLSSLPAYPKMVLTSTSVR